MMYVAHHLEEMFEIGDRVTVLRDGKFTAGAPMSESDRESLIAAMVGRKIESLYPAGNRTLGSRSRGTTSVRPYRAPAAVFRNRPGGGW
jgi:ribose transport system ATP-binding protein